MAIMEFVSYFFVLLVVMLGIPIGIFLAWLTKDELKGGRGVFGIIIWVCLVFSVFSLVFFAEKVFYVSVFLFIGLVSLVSLIKSYDW